MQDKKPVSYSTKSDILASQTLRLKLLEKKQLTIDSEIVSFQLDDKERIHSIEGPAIIWKDGFKAWFIHGAQFPPQIWERVVDRTIPAREAVALSNAEMRAITIERLGITKVLTELNATAVDEWRGYALYRLNYPDDYWEQEKRIWTSRGHVKFFKEKKFLTAQYLRCVDPSTAQIYFLRVPPPKKEVFENQIADCDSVDTCQEAVAWTFHMKAKDYPYFLQVET